MCEVCRVSIQNFADAWYILAGCINRYVFLDVEILAALNSA